MEHLIKDFINIGGYTEEYINNWGKTSFEESRAAFTEIFKNSIERKHGKLDYGKPKSKESRIAIIGAGPAGIHMATLLKERGYKNVTIYESSKRVGGKSFTAEDPLHTPQELGTCYTIPYKYQELRRVVEKYKLPFEEVNVLERNIYEDFKTSVKDSTDQDTFMISKIPTSILNLGIPALKKIALFRDCIRYIKMYKKLLGDCEDASDLMQATKGQSFLQYLNENGFSSLIPMFSLANTIQGYGYIETLPAIYGLWWNSPEEVLGFFKAALINGCQPATLLKDGFQVIWEDLSKKNKFPIKFDQKIVVEKRSDDSVLISNRGEKTEVDFLIVACPITLIDILDKTPDERRVIDNVDKTSNLCVTLFSVDKVTETDRAIHSWESAIVPKGEGDMMSIRSTARLLQKAKDEENEKCGKSAGKLSVDANDSTSVRDLPSKDNDIEYWCSYQYAPKAKQFSDRQLEQKLLANIKEVPFLNNPKVIQQKNWPYFTHPGICSLKYSNNFEDIVELGGAKNTWFIGSSVGFESVHDVTERNVMLADLFLEPKPK